MQLDRRTGAAWAIPMLWRIDDVQIAKEIFILDERIYFF